MNGAATTVRAEYQSSDPTRRTVGWAVVIAVHALVGWALVTGTARKGLELLKKPMEAAVIQEVIIPPPPPPKEIQKPDVKTPKLEAPPPPFVPPPEVAAPVTTAPAIQAVTTPPVTAPVIAPPPPPPPPAPPAPQVARREIGVACPTQVPPDMPRQAIRDGTEGVVKAQALIRDGTVREVTILSGPRVFHAAVRNAMLQYRCVSSAGDVLAVQEFAFKIE